MGEAYVKWNGDQVLRMLRESLIEELRAAGQLMVERARELCPVDTGKLRASIRFTIVANQVRIVIGSDVHYAGYIEFGTSRIYPRFFMSRAMNEVAPVLMQALADGMRARGYPFQYAAA